MSIELAERLFETTVRIAAVWPVAGLGEHLPEAFTRSTQYSSLPPEILKAMPHDQGDRDWDDEDWEEIRARLYEEQVFGFLCLAECPVFAPGVGGGASYSWGHFMSRLFYHDTAEGAIELACQWADDEFERAARGGAR